MKGAAGWTNPDEASTEANEVSEAYSESRESIHRESFVLPGSRALRAREQPGLSGVLLLLFCRLLP